jgi:hypothetical protein
MWAGGQALSAGARGWREFHRGWLIQGAVSSNSPKRRRRPAMVMELKLILLLTDLLAIAFTS